MMLSRTLLPLLLSLVLTAGLPLRGADAQEPVYDPFESTNRQIFWFNDQLDIYLFEPLGRGYDTIMPDPVERSITRFFRNLRFPRYLVSDLIQLDVEQAATHTGRFLINSTVGVLGFFDVADEWGLKEVEEDIGLALAHYDVPPGPYLVLPFFGPSNVRDAVGLVFDLALDPLYFVPYFKFGVGANVWDPMSISMSAVRIMNTRSGLLEAIETAKESSLDYYLFLQGAYYQHRWGLRWKGAPPAGDVFERAPDGALSLSETPEPPPEQ